MHHGRAGAEQGFDDEIPVGHGVHAVVECAVHVQLAGHGCGIERVGRPGEGGRAEGADAGALFAVGHALDVAAEHPGIGEQVMGEADGLRGLEVGAAGEDGVLMFFGAGHVYGGQFAGEALPFAEPVGDEQAEVERDLIVAAAARVELLAHVAHEFGEAAFDVHVDVFQFFFPLEGAVLDFRAHGGEAGDELIGFLGADDALPGQHTRVGARAGDILLVQGPVVGNGLRIGFNGSGGAFVEPSAPEFFFRHWCLRVCLRRQGAAAP